MDDPGLTARKVELCIESQAEIEQLLPLPTGVPSRADRIRGLARSISYHAPNKIIADLASKIGSEASEDYSSKISTYLSHLKVELEAVRRGLG